jgi:putative SOS response-associated peptidase YedK
MCTRYVSPEAAAIERAWHIGRHTPWQGAEVFPQRPGAFIRAARDSSEPARELVIGQWGLVPWFAKSPRLTYSTCNARSEEMANKATFKDSWRHGRRCIIPASSFDEPNWESGRNVWWRFRRVDGEPWGLAGLWSTWVDRATGELVESYTMLTINADHHPLMRRMHKPDPRLPPDAQDKRSVIPVAFEDVDLWLHGRTDDVRSLLRLDGNQPFEAGPADLDSGR